MGRRKEGHHGVESQAQCEGRSLGSELAGAWKEKSEEAACSPRKLLRRQAVAPRDRWVTLIRAACFLIVHQAAVVVVGGLPPPPTPRFDISASVINKAKQISQEKKLIEFY